MMISTETALENLTLNIQQEIRVNASLENTFEALLEQLGPSAENESGPMPMKLEAWPGGRWFRELGDNNGHCWGTVQAIKRPTLLEFSGPLFMSYPVVNNVQYRLSEEKDGTLIKFHHTALGLIQDEHRRGVVQGWTHMHNRARERAEGPCVLGAHGEPADAQPLDRPPRGRGRVRSQNFLSFPPEKSYRGKRRNQVVRQRQARDQHHGLSPKAVSEMTVSS